jgi:hypothetical protein
MQSHFLFNHLNFQWYMARLVLMNGHQNSICHTEIILYFIFLKILNYIVDSLGKTYVIIQYMNIWFNLL